MKNLYIVGAGQFGRELESWLRLVAHDKRDYDLVGFLDHPDALKGFKSSLQIVGHEDDFTFKENDFVLIAVTEVDKKRLIYQKLSKKVQLYTFISDRAIIGHYNTIGEGSIICPGVVITNNVRFGVCVTVNVGTQIGHDVNIGDYSSLMASIDIGGECKLGSEIFIGTKATILPRMTIGNRATIGSGSVVIKNVMQGTTVFGNPAKKI